MNQTLFLTLICKLQEEFLKLYFLNYCLVVISDHKNQDPFLLKGKLCGM